MNEKLSDLRMEIDCIDDQILILLKERVECMEKIGNIKKQTCQSIRDDKREREKMEKIEQKAKKLGLPLRLINQLWTALFVQSEEIEK